MLWPFESYAADCDKVSAIGCESRLSRFCNGYGTMPRVGFEPGT